MWLRFCMSLCFDPRLEQVVTLQDSNRAVIAYLPHIYVVCFMAFSSCKYGYTENVIVLIRKRMLELSEYSTNLTVESAVDSEIELGEILVNELYR